MSYCRFENTLNDLYDCVNSMDKSNTELSKRELAAKSHLIRLCKRIADDFDESDLEEMEETLRKFDLD